MSEVFVPGVLTASRTLGLIALTFGLLLLPILTFADIPEPPGFRLDNYDAPVPSTLTGATTVNGKEIRQLQNNTSAIVIDVIPESRKPADLPADQLWFPVPHTGVKDALWLPDVGFGELAPTTERYFQNHLKNATAGDNTQPLVFYCRTNCWMSWNAAKRALGYGYQHVYWYRDGIEDWLFEDFPTAILKPAPGQRHLQSQ